MIESECKFIEVERQIFGCDLVIDAHGGLALPSPSSQQPTLASRPNYEKRTGDKH